MPFIKINYYPDGFSAETDKQILKCKWKVKRPRKAKAILRKNKIGELTLPYFKNITKLQQSKQWHKDRCVHQWNKTESLKINPHIYYQFVFDKSPKANEQ